MADKAIVYLFLVAAGYVLTFVEPFWGIITFLYMNYIRPEVLSYGALTKYQLPQVTAILVILSSFFHSKFFKLPLVVASPIMASLLLMTVCMLLSGLGAINPSISNRYSADVFKFILIAILFVLLTDSEKKLNYLLLAHLIGGGFLALWSFEQHFRGNYRLELVGGGTTNTSNGLAALFILILPLYLHLIGHYKKSIQYSALLVSSLTIADIVFTQSRAAFIALLVQCGLLFWLYDSRKKYYFLLIVLPAFFYAALSTSMGDESYFDRITAVAKEGLDVDTSASSRKYLWAAAWEAFKEHPLLGMGQQNFKFLVEDYYHSAKGPTDAHNTFLLLLSEGGILTSFFYTFSLLSFFWILHKRRIYWKSLNKNEQANLALSLQAGMIGFLVCGLAHSYVVFEYYYYWLAFPLILNRIYPIRNVDI